MTRHYVISDLHLGMGRTDEGKWHPLEDFKSDELLRHFLGEIVDHNGDELIINGDWIDFLQLEPYAYDKDHSRYSEDGHILGWCEQDSLDKFDNCYKERAHKSFFDDLGHYLRSAGKTLTVIMGNHDPDLFWPRVQNHLRALLNPKEDAQLRFVQTFTRRGTAHIEHGNQHCSPENKFANPSNVFHPCTDDQLMRLEMVWGTVFVMEFFNDLEREHPYADNIKTQSRALWLGIKNGWVDGATAAKFVKFMWAAGIPWGSLTANVLGGKSRQPHQLMQEIPDPAIGAELLRLYASNAEFRRSFDNEIKETSERDWRALEKQAHLYESAAGDGGNRISIDQLTPNIDDPSPTMGLFREEPEFRGARKLLTLNGVKQVIFGHTHAELDGSESNANAKVKNYFNTGTWVNSMDLSLKKNRERLQHLKKEDLNDDNLFELRLRTAVIEVEKDGSTQVSLREVNPPTTINELVRG
jgi:UDP-2,3-diacylglucosamine pyrophosphatase LpxH